MPYIGNNHIAGDHTNNFKVLDDISSYTATFDGSAASVIDTTNNTIRIVEHRFIQGQRVTYTNGSGGNIGGLTTGTAYFVIFDSASTIKLATSASDAASNTIINLSAVGSGSSHTLNAAFDGVNTKFKLTHGSGTGARLNNATQINVAINNVVQRPNLDPNNFTDGFALEDNHKVVFKTAPTQFDIFWGSIIANTLTTFDISDHKIDTFTGDGSTTEFTLSHTPANNESLMVTINGVLQHPSNASTARAYTLIASIIQFTAAPGVGDEIQVRHMGFAGATTADVSGFYGRTGNVVLGSTDHITTGDITSRNINSSGIITASSFDGSFSSNVGGSNANFTGIVTAGVFKGGDIEGRNLKITGLSTFVGDASFSGNVSIGGTLTYEDVTNIDSVGVITARDGIDCNADLDVDGHTNLDNVSVAGVTTFATTVHLNTSSDPAPTRLLNIAHATSSSPLVRIYNNHANGRKAQIEYKNTQSTFTQGISQGSPHGFQTFSINPRPISFWNSSLERLRVESSGNISIFKDLDVDGHTNLDNVSIVGVATVTGNIEATGEIKSLTLFESTSGNDLRLNAGSANRDIFLQVNDSTLMTVQGSTGRVGIGTDNPQAKLEIAGSTTNVLGYSDGQVQIVGNNPIAFVSQSNLNPALNRWGFKLASQNDGDFSIYDYRNSKNRLLINSSGNIGINTTFPTEMLDVRGNLVVAESIAVNRPRIVLSAPNDGTNYRHLFGANLKVDSSGTFTTPTANISGGGWEYLPANSLNSHGKLRYLSAPDTNATSSTPEERLRIDATGRVLIGLEASTQSDSYMQVFKKTGNDATITVGNVATSASGLCRIDFCPSNKVVGSRIECHATEDFSTTANRTADLVFITRNNGTNSEKVRITSEGYVHLGNTGHGTNKVGGQSVTGQDFDPYFKLYASTSNHWLMQLRSDTNSGSNGIFMRAGFNQNNYTMYLTGTDENTPHFVVRGDGNVGINDANPAAKFVVNNGTNDAQFVQMKNDNVGLFFGAYGTGATYDREATINGSRTDSGSSPYLRIAGQGGIKFCVDLNSPRVEINSSGSLIVGGTSTFGAAGSFSVGANGTFRSVLASGTAQDTLIAGISGVSNGFQLTTDASNNQTYTFHSGSNKILVINKDGDMGLGTGANTVTQRLDVRESSTSIFDPVSNLPTIARLYNTSATNGASAGLQLRTDNNNGAAGIQYIHAVNSSTNYSSDLVFSRRLATSGSYAEQCRITNQGFLKFPDSTKGIEDGTYNYVYPGNYRTASNLARFMAPVNYASGVYWGGGNGTAVSPLSAAYDTNTGGNFGSNGGASENNLGYADHNGLITCASVWRAQNNDSASGPDGGWNKGINGLPGDDWGYMVTCHVRRVGSNTSGSFYYGCSGSHTISQAGVAQNNPYFFSMGISTLPQDIWVLVIGIITPHGAGQQSNPTVGSLNGMWRLDSGDKITSGNMYRMKDGSTSQTHRTYLFYSTQSAAHLQWRQPGFYVMDGSEPSIAELSHGRLCFKAGTGIVPVEDA